MACIAFIFSSQHSFQAITEREAQLYFFNLSDGEATLVRTPEEKYYLINTGSIQSRHELLSQLDHLDITQIDGLILTEDATQYSGNAHEIIEEFNVNEVYLSMHSPIQFFNEASSVEINKVTNGDQIMLDDALAIKVLATDTDGGMSFLLQYGVNSVLFMGIDDPNHDQLLLDYRFNADIIKIADFAQGYSPSESLLQAFDPHIGIIFHEKLGSINEEIIHRLEASWVEVYQLKLVGTTMVRLTGEDYEISP